MEAEAPFSPHSLHASRSPQSSQQPETHQKLETNSHSKPPTQLHKACLEEGPPEWFCVSWRNAGGFQCSLGVQGSQRKGLFQEGTSGPCGPHLVCSGWGK